MDGRLAFGVTLDFENPTDQDRDNQYQININATDSDDKTGSSSVTVTVTDVNETGEEAIDSYDANGDGSIDRAEALTAIRDYFNDVITQDEVLAIITRYFIG